MEKIQNYIGGKFIGPQNGNFLDNVNPSTGKIYSLVPDSNEKDVDAAVLAAVAAYPEWSNTPASIRSEYLNKISQKILANLDELAMAESIDNGKPLSLCKSLDIPRAATNFKFFAEAISQFHGEAFSTDQNSVMNALNYTTYSPLGVVVCISPWNLPLYSLTWKIAPALAAGNTVIAKPSELTPMTAFLFSKLVSEAGLPPGVLNILHGTGRGVGTPLITHPKVKAVSFTGSTQTGRTIASATAADFKKVSLEMGGKNANIIFADADFEKALKSTIRSSFLNQGQICLCGSRIFVERSIYNKFRDALVEETKKLKQGNPLSDGIDQGAVVSRNHMEKILSYIDLARAEGGKILCGGKREMLSGEQAEGFFIQPTLIEGLPFSCRTNQEEIFGPVATLIPFENEEELIAMVNSTKHGLSASVWTTNITRGLELPKKIEAGVVWVNTWMLRDLRTPFGGVKESGLGREGGMHALEFFSEIKNICVGLS
ncbi:MAG: aldehyde dehydrogenase [Bacteriovorax sp.]|jgi:aminomuconate-semialdehyde/2-hydroxymuconate-6-semialdehyde dehydrogenase